MKLYFVSCEWDIGLNVDGYQGVYSSQENYIDALNIDFKSIGINEFDSWEDAYDEGFIVIEEIDG